MKKGALVLSVSLVLSLIGCTSSSHDTHNSADSLSDVWPQLPVTEIRAITNGCVAHPSARSGKQLLAVTNTSQTAVTFRILLADSPAAIFEIEPVGPVSRRAQPIQLGPGRYRYECLFEERRVIRSEPFSVESTGGNSDVEGSLRSALPVEPVSVQELTPVAHQYEQWVAQQLVPLYADAQHVRAGSEKGRTAWLAAHRRYATLGAAYDAFGEVGEAIDEAFTASESALWEGKGDVATAGNDLADSIHDLMSVFPDNEVDPLDIGLRAHEIIEDSLEQTLTGRDDAGSHSAAITLSGNIEGVSVLLRLLDPLLQSRLSTREKLQEDLSRSRDVLQSLPPLGEWDRPTRQRVAASLGNLVEHLAKVAAICDVRRKE